MPRMDGTRYHEYEYENIYPIPPIYPIVTTYLPMPFIYPKPVGWYGQGLVNPAGSSPGDAYPRQILDSINISTGLRKEEEYTSAWC